MVIYEWRPGEPLQGLDQLADAVEQGGQLWVSGEVVQVEELEGLTLRAIRARLSAGQIRAAHRVEASAPESAPEPWRADYEAALERARARQAAELREVVERAEARPARSRDWLRGRRGLTCETCRTVRRTEQAGWAPTGRVRWVTTAGRRREAEISCLGCASTWWTAAPAALREADERREGAA